MHSCTLPKTSSHSPREQAVCRQRTFHHFPSIFSFFSSLLVLGSVFIYLTPTKTADPKLCEYFPHLAQTKRPCLAWHLFTPSKLVWPLNHPPLRTLSGGIKLIIRWTLGIYWVADFSSRIFYPGKSMIHHHCLGEYVFFFTSAMHEKTMQIQEVIGGKVDDHPRSFFASSSMNGSPGFCWVSCYRVFVAKTPKRCRGVRLGQFIEWKGGELWNRQK